MNPTLLRYVRCAEIFGGVGGDVISMDHAYECANPFNFTGVNIHLKLAAFKELFAQCEVKREFRENLVILYALYNSILFTAVEVIE